MTIASLLGIANNNKRQIVQPTLDSFFGGGATLRTADDFDEHGIRGCKCAYCGVWNTPQGMPNHVASHVRKGDTRNPSRVNPQGRVVAPRAPCPPPRNMTEVTEIVDEMRAAGAAATEVNEIVEEEIADEATEAINKSNRVSLNSL
jgi:hypothetical protein